MAYLDNELEKAAEDLADVWMRLLILGKIEHADEVRDIALDLVTEIWVMRETLERLAAMEDAG